MTPRQQEVREKLTAEPSQTITAIAKQLGISRDALYKHINRLIELKYLRKKKRGNYVIKG